MRCTRSGRMAACRCSSSRMPGAPVAASMIGPRLRALRIPVRSGLVLARHSASGPTPAPRCSASIPTAVRDLMRPAAEVLGVRRAHARARARARIGRRRSSRRCGPNGSRRASSRRRTPRSRRALRRAPAHRLRAARTTSPLAATEAGLSIRAPRPTLRRRSRALAASVRAHPPRSRRDRSHRVRSARRDRGGGERRDIATPPALRVSSGPSPASRRSTSCASSTSSSTSDRSRRVSAS